MSKFTLVMTTLCQVLTSLASLSNTYMMAGNSSHFQLYVCRGVSSLILFDDTNYNIHNISFQQTDKIIKKADIKADRQAGRWASK